MFLILCLYCFAIMLVLLTSKIKIEIFQKYRIKLKHKVMFDGTIEFLSEGYLNMAISCFIELVNMKHGNNAERFSLVLAFIFAAIIIRLPLFYLIALQKNK